MEEKRELATEIRIPKSSNKPLELKYIGEGTTCVVYKITTEGDNKGNIIKEFYPIINNVPAMRRSNKNEELKEISNLQPLEKKILKERRDAFFESEISIINTLRNRNVNSNENMFVIPTKLEDTSLGACQKCEYIGGETLASIFSKNKDKPFKERFLEVLKHITWLFNEIAFYHYDIKDGEKNNTLEDVILNLDIKPENLFVINADGGHAAIRNLDFGSAKNASKLLDDIQIFVKENNNSNTNDIIAKFFASSFGYYAILDESGRVAKIVENCIYGNSDRKKLIEDLKTLDILAALKTFLYALTDSVFDDKYYITGEREKIFSLFQDIFKNKDNELTVHGSLFESFNIYSQLYEIMARSFGSDYKIRLTATEIASRLKNILCIMNAANIETTEQRRAVEMNEIYCQQDYLLKDKQLNSVNDIIDFCEKHRVDICELSSLNWFLLTGETFK